MTEELTKTFIDKVKVESTYKKFVNIDIIKMLITIFSGQYQRQSYPNNITNPLEKALQFYKDYNEKYYDMIIKGIANKKIIISKENTKSFIDATNNIALIRLYGNDSDIFILVHEFAHFIDRNSNPQIVPDKYWFLSEVFSFYMEKKLENWLDKTKYKDLILIRNNNRLYYESEMIKAIDYELYYEHLYNAENSIETKDLDVKKVKHIMKYDTSNLVNYLLTYPLANLISSHLIQNNLIENNYNLVEKCLDIDLYKLLHNNTRQRIKKMVWYSTKDATIYDNIIQKRTNFRKRNEEIIWKS